jgi:predicted transcriptional regulator
MLIRSKKITIVKISKPVQRDLNHELQWIGDSLGLFNLRDKDRSCFRIFIELLKSAKLRQPLSSDEIASRLNLTRGTVVHHINRLMESGIVVHHKNKYLLRVDNLASLIEELHRDIRKTCSDLKEIAADIDKAIGL